MTVLPSRRGRRKVTTTPAATTSTFSTSSSAAVLSPFALQRRTVELQHVLETKNLGLDHENLGHRALDCSMKHDTARRANFRDTWGVPGKSFRDKRARLVRGIDVYRRELGAPDDRKQEI